MGGAACGRVNQTAAVALYYAVQGASSTRPPLNASTRHVQALASAARGQPDSPLAVSAAVLAVFVLSPLIVCGNALVLSAVVRFKRLRTPSNYLVAALAASDLGAGLLLPVGLYLELSNPAASPMALCLLPYCVAIALGSASLCAMAAIALDRFTSLAQPLRYNNLITHSSVERYIVGLWLYSLIVASAPLIYPQPLPAPHQECSFSVIAPPVQLFLFCSVYGPCAAVVLACYGYIYVVARYHARAIYSVELSLRQPESVAGLSPAPTPTPVVAQQHSRYGQTLALTVGLFLLLWLPFITCMMLDVLRGSQLLKAEWAAAGLAVPVFASSALNPWVYGLHNSEVRLGVQRVLDELLARLGLGHGSACRDVFAAEMNSYASNARLCAVSPHHQGTPGPGVRSLLLPRRDTIECSTLGSAAKETVVHLELPDTTALKTTI